LSRTAGSKTASPDAEPTDASVPPARSAFHTATSVGPPTVSITPKTGPVSVPAVELAQLRMRDSQEVVEEREFIEHLQR